MHGHLNLKFISNTLNIRHNADGGWSVLAKLSNSHTRNKEQCNTIQYNTNIHTHVLPRLVWVTVRLGTATTSRLFQ